MSLMAPRMPFTFSFAVPTHSDSGTCDLLWPMGPEQNEWKHRLAKYLFAAFFHSCLCEQTWTSLLADKRPHGAELSHPMWGHFKPAGSQQSCQTQVSLLRSPGKPSQPEQKGNACCCTPLGLIGCLLCSSTVTIDYWDCHWVWVSSAVSTAHAILGAVWLASFLISLCHVRLVGVSWGSAGRFWWHILIIKNNNTGDHRPLSWKCVGVTSSE